MLASVTGHFRAKKDGTNGYAVRAGRPVTQTTSRSGVVDWTVSITGIYTRYYIFDFKQIQKSKFSHNMVRETWLPKIASYLGHNVSELRQLSRDRGVPRLQERY